MLCLSAGSVCEFCLFWFSAALYGSPFPPGKEKSVLFISPDITNFPQGALKSVQHMKPAVRRLSIQIREKHLPIKTNGGKLRKSS